MAAPSLDTFYGDYIDCLNRREWDDLGRFVGDDVRHNDRPLGLDGYRAMLEADVAAIPDLRFIVDLLVCDPPWIASRLSFACSPRGSFLGLPVNGRTVRFSENVFYQVCDGRIATVLSVIDKAAIEVELARRPGG